VLLTLLKKSLFYCFSIGTEALIAAALLPMLTRHIPPEEYGTWVLFVALFSFMRPILGLMLQDVIKMRFFELTEGELRLQLRTGIAVSLGIFSILLCLTWAGRDLFSGIIPFPGEYFWLVLATAFLHSLLYAVLAVMQFRERHELFLYTQALQAVLAISLTYVLVRAGYSWLGAGLGRIGALVVVDALGLWWLTAVLGNPFTVKFRLPVFREVIATGLRFLPVGLTPVLIPLTNRLLLAHFWGNAQTAYYGIASLLSMVICIGYAGLLSALQPILFRTVQGKPSTAAEPQNIRRFCIAYFLLVALGALLVVGFALSFGHLLISYDMAQIKPYIVWLALGVTLEGFYFHNLAWLHAQKSVGTISTLSYTVIILDLCLALIVIPYYGGIGAAQATVISYLIVFVISSIILRNKHRA